MTRSQFQSLFSWMFPSKSRSNSSAIVRTSFNPCSLGCFPRRLSIFTEDVRFCSFNPCSLGCFPRRYCYCGFRSPGCVSILVLLDVSLEGIRVYCLIRVQVVSILVLLDVSLEVRQHCQRRYVKRGFNPCSLGCFPRSGGYPYAVAYDSTGFNPCSLGCFPRSTGYFFR